VSVRGLASDVEKLAKKYIRCLEADPVARDNFKNAWWFAFLNDPQTFAMVDGRNGPRLAQIGHDDRAERCPIPAVKRTWLGDYPMWKSRTHHAWPNS
jgi:hypothetical protein